jgi:DNA-binding CsgD family transcriptional regulator
MNMTVESFEGYLTPRERQVVELIIDGYSAKEIGKMLSISPRTVEAHRWNICRKLGARNTADIVRIVLEARLANQPHVRPDIFSDIAEEADGDKGLFFINSADVEWNEVMPGISIKVLFKDEKRNYSTKLVKMEPGARYPRHLHRAPEELYMLEGDFQVAGRSLAPGDYHRADSKSIHNETSTRSGCRFLLLSSHLDVILD